MKTPSGPNRAKKTILVIGGNGFIGRHIVRALPIETARVLVGTRRHGNDKNEDDYTRHLPLHVEKSDLDWVQALRGVDVVINAVGILRQRWGESYEQIHHLAVAKLAALCATKGIRFVHISIMGINSPATSRFVTSKQRGERAVRDSNADWYIVRPSLVDGKGGFGAKWFRRVAAWPIHFSPANAVGKFAPIDADDLGEAIANIALGNQTPATQEQRIYELGGDHILTITDYLRRLQPEGPTKPNIAVPAWCARLVSHLCDLIHFSPFSFGHYQLLQYRNHPEHNRLSEVLGRPASRVPNWSPASVAPQRAPTVPANS